MVRAGDRRDDRGGYDDRGGGGGGGAPPEGRPDGRGGVSHDDGILLIIFPHNFHRVCCVDLDTLAHTTRSCLFLLLCVALRCLPHTPSFRLLHARTIEYSDEICMRCCNSVLCH